MVYLLPHSGLANRVRVILSGLTFSDKVNQPLTVIWSKDESLFCDFHDLYEVDDKFVVKNYGFIYKLLKKALKSPLLKAAIYRMYSIDFSLFDKDIEAYVWSTGSDIINYQKLPQKVRNYFFSTCHEFDFDRKYLSCLRPVKSIRDMVDKNTLSFTGKTIGIHIRRTDNLESITESPVDRFIQAMRYEVEADPAVNFFLATDDPEVESMLIQKFAGKVCIYKKDYSRSTEKGIKDAMVDLYSLANTCKIYGSYYSSYSHLASRIGDIPLTIIRKD